MYYHNIHILQHLRDVEDTDEEESSVSTTVDDSSSHNGSQNYPSSTLPTYFLGTHIPREQNSGDVHFQSNSGDDGEEEDNTAALPNIHHTSASNTQQSNGEDNDNTPWKSSKAKQQIIDELKDETSDIHLLIGKYTPTEFKEVNFNQIHQKYAKNFKRSNFRENVKRLLRHLLARTGPFKPEEDITEPWWTSVNNVSPAYALLFLLYMDSSKSRILNEMTAEEIWLSHAEFQKYDLSKFNTYNTKMKKLTEKRKELIHEEEASYHRDMLKLPKMRETNRGYPFWNTHIASDLLEQDEENGIATQMKPKQLWASRAEYRDFPLSVFRKHIYQLRTKKLAAPYWQYKRNKNAKKKYEEAEEMMKEWQQARFHKSMEGLIDDWEKFIPSKYGRIG
jgi:hypothetical protein